MQPFGDLLKRKHNTVSVRRKVQQNFLLVNLDVHSKMCMVRSYWSLSSDNMLTHGTKSSRAELQKNGALFVSHLLSILARISATSISFYYKPCNNRAADYTVTSKQTLDAHGHSKCNGVCILNVASALVFLFQTADTSFHDNLANCGATTNELSLKKEAGSRMLGDIRAVWTKAGTSLWSTTKTNSFAYPRIRNEEKKNEPNLLHLSSTLPPHLAYSLPNYRETKYRLLQVIVNICGFTCRTVELQSTRKSQGDTQPNSSTLHTFLPSFSPML